MYYPHRYPGRVMPRPSRERMGKLMCGSASHKRSPARPQADECYTKATGAPPHLAIKNPRESSPDYSAWGCNGRNASIREESTSEVPSANGGSRIGRILFDVILSVVGCTVGSFPLRGPITSMATIRMVWTLVPQNTAMTFPFP